MWYSILQCKYKSHQNKHKTKQDCNYHHHHHHNHQWKSITRNPVDQSTAIVNWYGDWYWPQKHAFIDCSSISNNNWLIAIGWYWLTSIVIDHQFIDLTHWATIIIITITMYNRYRIVITINVNIIIIIVNIIIIIITTNLRTPWPPAPPNSGGALFWDSFTLQLQDSMHLLVSLNGSFSVTTLETSSSGRTLTLMSLHLDTHCQENGFLEAV